MFGFVEASFAEPALDIAGWAYREMDAPLVHIGSPAEAGVQAGDLPN